jgi:hypothetical protein
MFSAQLYKRVAVISDLFAADFHRRSLIIISGRPSSIFRLATLFFGHITENGRGNVDRTRCRRFRHFIVEELVYWFRYKIFGFVFLIGGLPPLAVF